MQTQQPITADDAVRRYLQYLTNPNLLRDEARIAQLREAADTTNDLLERARLLGQAHKAGHVDEAALRAGFVAHAKAWAGANDVPAAVFLEMGVDSATLAEAGFDVKVRQKSARQTGRKTTAPRPVPVRVERVKAHMLSRTAPFTLSEVSKEVGGSAMTVRRAASELVAEGKLKDLGPLPGHQGRGRAPTQYQVVSNI
jgi:hypothetical protein